MSNRSTVQEARLSRFSLQLIAVCCANSTKLMGPDPSPRRRYILCPMCISFVFIVRKHVPGQKTGNVLLNKTGHSTGL